MEFIRRALAGRRTRETSETSGTNERRATNMELGIFGLGRMGGNMATRLARGGHRVVASNRSPGPVDEAKEHGAVPAYSMEDMVNELKDSPRIVWLMVPSGQVTDETLHHVMTLLKPGDIIIDGGNSNFHDTIRRAQEVSARGLHYMDCGTSGGIWGLKEGYSLMIGGEREIFQRCEPLFKTGCGNQHLGCHKKSAAHRGRVTRRFRLGPSDVIAW